MVVPTVLGAIALAVVGVKAEDSDTIPLWGLALLQVPLWLMLGGIPWLVIRRKGSGSVRRDLGLSFRPVDLAIGAVAGFGSQIALGIVLVPVYDLLGIDRDEVGRTARELGDRVQDPLGFVSLFVVAVLAAAFLEELFYRGFLLGALRKRWAGTLRGDRLAIAISAVVFGVMHFQGVDTIPLAVFGAVLAWLVVRSGRLGPAICAHLAFNLTAFVSLVHN